MPNQKFSKTGHLFFSNAKSLYQTLKIPINFAIGRIQPFCFTFFLIFLTYYQLIARRWFWCHWINDESINNRRIQRCTFNGSRSAWVGIHMLHTKKNTPIKSTHQNPTKNYIICFFFKSQKKIDFVLLTYSTPIFWSSFFFIIEIPIRNSQILMFYHELFFNSNSCTTFCDFLTFKSCSSSELFRNLISHRN